MLPMPGLAWQGKDALRMHEFRNPLAQARSRIPTGAAVPPMRQ